MNPNCCDEGNAAMDLADASEEILLSEFRNSLLAEGYSAGTSKVFVSAASHLIRWAARSGTTVGNFNDEAIAAAR
jgi:hypothetical protein